MIEPLFSLDALATPRAFACALLLGGGFGFALERAGFSSSRRLAGVFYFTDMAVVKVMFSALITALLGISYLVGFGWLQLDQLFLLPTIYGAQIVGGLLFGVGFVMSSWCPGTAAAGLAAGRIDALIFLVGAAAGCVLFNEVYPLVRSLTTAGNQGTQFIETSLGVSRRAFIFSFTLVAVASFWLAEWAEKQRNGRAPYLGTPFLQAYSVALIALAGGLLILGPVTTPSAPAKSVGENEQALLRQVEQAEDHVEPEALAEAMLAREANLVVVDVRPAAEFAAFHLRGALNVPLAQLAESLAPHREQGRIVLYSNGITHPAQARDSLARQGFNNVFLLTDGLDGFRDRVLKPISLRSAPLAAGAGERVQAWRAFFLADPAIPLAKAESPRPGAQPRIVETEWLSSQLGQRALKVIDLRSQPDYNTAHIPGSLSLNVESLRGNIGGVPSMLLPAPMLAAQFSLLGLQLDDTIVVVSGDKLYDTTLFGMACERMGHLNYAVLNGGYAKWAQEKLPANAFLPTVTVSPLPATLPADTFTIDYLGVVARLAQPGTVIIDVRPADYYTGKKSDEARAGHIPGALSHPFSEDVSVSASKIVVFEPIPALAAAYARIIPTKDTEVIVHCRTGHQASQTFFLLKRVLGYSNVRWYDAGWTEWAARTELPVVTEAPNTTPPK